jgi:DNA primase
MSQVDEVRTAADIVKIAGDYVKLRKAGANFVGLCPFHQEKTPSFAVHPVKQIFHCFGCGVGGDVFKFVMLIESVSFPEALERVAERVGVKLERRAGGEAHDAQARERIALFKIHEEAAKFYAAQMSGTAEGRAARAYLADRGVSDESVGRFRLGYAPGEGQALSRQLSQMGFSTELLEKSGLIVSDAGRQRRYDRFRRRIIFPISNESRKVVAFGARALGEEMPKYLNSPETPIYSKGRVLYNLDRAASAIRTADEAVLVEGYMDCIAVESCGIGHVVASCGTSLTEAQIRLMARHTRRVIVNYDPDSAGKAATERSLEMLLEAAFEIRALALPVGLDPDTFIRRRGAEAYREALRAVPGYLDYLTDQAIQKHGLRSPEGKVAAANAVMPYLSKIPNALMRREIADRIASRLQIDDRVLREQLKQVATERRREVVAAEPKTATGHGERKLLRAFLESEDLLDRYLPALAAEGLLDGLPTEEVFRKLLEARQAGPVDVHRLEEMLSPEAQAILRESLLQWGDAQGEQELAAFCSAWRREKLEQKRVQIQIEIEDATRRNDGARLAELMRAKNNFLKDLATSKRE